MNRVPAVWHLLLSTFLLCAACVSPAGLHKPVHIITSCKGWVFQQCCHSTSPCNPTALSAACARQTHNVVAASAQPCIVVPVLCSPLPHPCRLSTSVAKPQVQVVTHLCYSDFQDIMQAVDDMDGEPWGCLGPVCVFFFWGGGMCQVVGVPMMV